MREIDAKAACAYLLATKKIEELGKTQVFAQPIYSTKYNLQREVYTGLSCVLECILQSQTSIRYKVFDNTRSVSISITADSNGDIAEVRKALDPLFSGIVVRDKENGNRPMWDRRFLSSEFQCFVKTCTSDGRSAIVANNRLRQVLVFGSETEIPRLQQSVLHYWKSCQIQTH